MHGAVRYLIANDPDVAKVAAPPVPDHALARDLGRADQPGGPPRHPHDVHRRDLRGADEARHAPERGGPDRLPAPLVRHRAPPRHPPRPAPDRAGVGGRAHRGHPPARDRPHRRTAACSPRPWSTPSNRRCGCRSGGSSRPPCAGTSATRWPTAWASGARRGGSCSKDRCTTCPTASASTRRAHRFLRRVVRRWNKRVMRKLPAGQPRRRPPGLRHPRRARRPASAAPEQTDRRRALPPAAPSAGRTGRPSPADLQPHRPPTQSIFGQRRCWRRRWPARPRARRSPRAHVRRQPVASGPVSDGVSPRPARRPRRLPVGRGLVGQRGDRRARCGRRSGGRPRRRRAAAARRRSRWCGRGLGRFMPLRRMRPVPSRWTGTTGTPQRTRQVGGAAAERLAPAVGGAAALGEDQQAPAVVDEVGGEVGRAAVDLRALDRDGAEGEGRRPSP